MNSARDLQYDEGIVKFAADVEKHLRPFIPKRLRLTCERLGMAQWRGVLLRVWDERGSSVAEFMHPNQDSVEDAAHCWQNLIARSLMRIEVERDKQST